MKRCKKCRAEMADNMMFCTKCGTESKVFTSFHQAEFVPMKEPEPSPKGFGTRKPATGIMDEDDTRVLAKDIVDQKASANHMLRAGAIIIAIYLFNLLASSESSIGLVVFSAVFFIIGVFKTIAVHTRISRIKKSRRQREEKIHE